MTVAVDANKSKTFFRKSTFSISSLALAASGGCSPFCFDCVSGGEKEWRVRKNEKRVMMRCRVSAGLIKKGMEKVSREWKSV